MSRVSRTIFIIFIAASRKESYLSFRRNATQKENNARTLEVQVITYVSEKTQHLIVSSVVRNEETWTALRDHN